MPPSPSPARALLTKAQLGGPGLRTFANISREWQLTVDQQACLLGLPKSTFFALRKKAIDGIHVDLGKDTLERLSYLLGIYSALRLLLPQTYAGWIKRPNSNPLFGGHSALDRMLSGNVADLYVVRNFLDAWRGGWS